ncbi:SF0329 family protein [Acetivibrio clariflavus]|uniref:Uncharacterized protein n=1 Tax=Acetivibrio clariflavus (strain DSM 19732 / NBRC 101661 / EBR45) TaxID=720554 RepID=G8M1T9_ACECE|nr:hypothetical protein [Acetivibrio clariflavus]AEV67022.1 hypothetical protein Clocl_0281 [Acetivibrio clariflavus DSM 19732]HOQ01689.1 hypothetical protein [Acetivibrio clariflavus]
MWSKLKKQLEDFICPCLKGRVEFWITNYRKAHDQMGRAYITVDGKEVVNMCSIKKEIAIYNAEKEIRDSENICSEQDDFKQDKMYELLKKEGFAENILSQIAINRNINNLAHKKIEEQDIFSQYDFLEAAEKFLSSPIEESLRSDNSIVKALALIDRRVGKRTLKRLKESIKDESELVKYFYSLRCEAEQI